MSSRNESTSEGVHQTVAAPKELARWEWRTFDYQPECWQAALGLGRVMTKGSLSTETYLLTPGSTANVKLRNDRLEIKRLLATRPDGLQQWWPVLRAPFPLLPAALVELLAVWHCDPPEPLPRVASADGLVALLLGLVPNLHVVPVRKWRRGYDVDGCRAERATILARGEVIESLAFEHEDPDLLWATLQSRHLEAIPNTSYPAALGRLVGWPSDPATSPRVPGH